MLTAIIAGLAARFPAVHFDTGAVEILRQSPARLLTVSTNLAGFHSAPSRTSERQSELLDGEVVESLIEQDSWTFARQQDGYLGWTYRPYLAEMPSPSPTHIIIEPVSLLRSEPDLSAPLASRLMIGTKVLVAEMGKSWARVVPAGQREGWLPSANLRALAALPLDEAARRRQIVEDALRLVGVPYLWGGCTAQGIDCSGLSRLLHRLVGISLPRDADMQMDAGMPVDPPFEPGDLLFFGSTRGHRAISHVAVSLGGWQVIHSSGPRNGVYCDDVQAVSWLREAFVGACTFVRASPED